jgi:hypothetical protein
MLRQALDAARGQQQQLFESESRSVTETDSLLPDSQQDQMYGAASSNLDEEDEGVEGSYEDEDEDYIIQDWQEGAVEEATFMEKAWKKTKGCFVLVLNVENLWDSPSMNGAHVPRSRRNNFVVLFWFFILASFYASERSTFKLLVDRTGPFRLFAVEMVTFSHAIMVGAGMLISAISRKNFKMQPLGIPIVDVARKLQPFNKHFDFGKLLHTGLTKSLSFH